MSSNASTLTAPQRVFIGYLLGLFVLFGAVIGGVSSGIPHFVGDLFLSFWANFTKLYPFMALTGGICWSAHVVMRKPLAGHPVDIAGTAFLLFAMGLYWSLGTELMQLSKSPVYLATLYTSLSVLVFPLALLAVSVITEFESEDMGAVVPMALFPAAWLLTYALATQAGLSGSVLGSVLAVHILTNLATLFAAYLYIAAIERQEYESQMRNRVLDAAQALGEASHVSN